jgi:A/G-specific adenine glycosylase
MELGAIICLPRKPLCFLCPVRSFCQARDPDSLPKKRERPKIERKNEFHFFALKDGCVLLQQNPGKRWQGLWTLPALPADSRSARSEDARNAFLSLSYPITRFVVRLNVFLSDPPAAVLEGQAWHRLELLDCLPMPSPHRRAVQMALRKGGLISP